MACKLCWHPGGSSKHNEGCPLSGGSRKEFDRGWSGAFTGGLILPWYSLRFYPASFRLGYRVGRNDLEALVDEALVGQFYDR